MKKTIPITSSISHTRTRKLAVVLSIATMLVFAMIGNGSADNIDVELIRKGRDILKYLQKNGYDNVGVLPFRLKKGTGKTTFSAGLINSNMAERVENALVLATNPEEKPIGIIRDAGSVARQSDPHANYRTPDGRRRLFRVKYPLAWDESTKVNPDAFLCGKVSISPDYRKATVAVESFDIRKPGSFTKVLEFDVKTDRQILADIGQGFSLWKGKGRFRRAAKEYDEIIIIDDEEESSDSTSDDEEASSDSTSDDEEDSGDSTSDGEEDSGGSNTNADSNTEEVALLDPVTPDDTEDFPVRLAVLYDGEEQTLSKDPIASSVDGGATTVSMVVKDPSEGQKVTFRIRNTTNDTVGIVLTVNGESTLYGEKGQADQMTKWVLAPATNYEIKGTYDRDHNNYVPLVGLSDEQSKEVAGDFQENAGLIHLHVFAKVSGGGEVQLASQLKRSLRNVSSRQAPSGKVRTVDDLQRKIAATSNARSTRGLIASDDSRKRQEIETKALGDVSHTNTMIIRYYTPKG